MIEIIEAMDEEVAKVKEQTSDAEVKTIAGMDFYKGTMCHEEIIVVRSDIDKVNAAVCSQVLADQYHVTAIIDTGIAGSLGNEINIGDVVLSTDALHHDTDASDFGYPVGQISSVDVLFFPVDKHLLKVAQSCYEKAVPGIGAYIGRIASGDQFISDEQKKQWLTDTFDGYCTEMGDAAIVQAAYLSNIPCLIIRAISDKADDSVETDYAEFEAVTIHNSVKLLTAII